MVSNFISLLDIQSWWEIPCIAHFCSLFSSAFNLPDIDIEDLESALLTDGADDTVGLLPELIVRLLKGCDQLKNRCDITTSNYQMFLRRFLRLQCRRHNTENYFDTDIDFQSLPLRNRILILYSLIHFRLDSNNVQPILENLEADSLRVEPLGYDSQNSGYWYFYGTRLYREDTKSGGKTIWQVVCFTEEDWQHLTRKFKNSKIPKERALYKILKGNFIPKLPQLFRERERLRRRKLLQVRHSARINDEKQRLLTTKQETEALHRRKIEEELKIQTANKDRTRTRRRSQSSSTASGISTYASSVRASSPASEFFTQHETFCLSPGLGDVDGEVESNSPKYSCTSYNNADATIKHIDSDHQEDYESDSLNIANRHKISGNECDAIEFELQGKFKRFHAIESNGSDVESQSGKQSNHSISSKRSKKRYQKVKYSTKSRLQHIRRDSSTSSSDSESNSTLARRKQEMAPTTNVKLPGRQTNNSLSSIPENLFLPAVLPGGNDSKSNKSKTSKTASENAKPKEKDKDKDKEKDREKEKVLGGSTESNVAESASSGQKKRKNKTSESYSEKDETLQIGMHKVLLYVKNHRDAWPFMDPVDEEIAPRYYSIIRRPMDLLKMEEKLDNEEYKKYGEFRNDFKLIVNNCRLYNGQNNEYTEMVNNLQEAFDKATKKYLDQHSSDEDESFEYPDPRSTVFREKSYKSAAKTIQNDSEKEGGKKCGESPKRSDESDDAPNDEENENNSENKGSKKKRKDKDKRRKKKTKGKSQTTTVGTDEEDDTTLNEQRSFSDKHSNEDETDATVAVKRAIKRPHEKPKSKSSEPPVKRTKNKSSQKEKLHADNDDAKQSNKKANDKKTKKSSKFKSVKTTESLASDEELEQDGKMRTDSETEDLETPRHSSKKKQNSGHESNASSKKKPSSVEKANTSNDKSDKAEKNNQNSKSKSGKSNATVNAKESATKANPKAIKNRQKKDNKKNSNGVNKKRKGRKKKTDDKSVENEDDEEENGRNSDTMADIDRESMSRGSSPLFKVDLHEKYAKSASIKDEDESSCDEIKCGSPSPIKLLDKNKGSNDGGDLLSITSQSLSRSASPFNSCESDIDASEQSKSINTSTRKESKTSPTDDDELTKATSMEIDPSPSNTSSSYFYLDKYDLIKQRRNRNTEEKWNQIVKEAEKIKDTKKATASKNSNSSLSKEKNQKLKETIEKLKVKNAKSKERSTLIDEIFGVKPAQQPRDEKTIFEKLRESCVESKSPSSAKKNAHPALPTPATPVKPTASQDTYEFVDESPPVKPAPIKKDTQPSEKTGHTPKKTNAKKPPFSAPNNPKKSAGTPSKTNLEALELETEQTLKDINRWLEHTPRFPEFSSASNSPSRYNLLDDFDAVTSKIDPNDFRRPVSLSAAKLEAVGIDEIADNKPDVIEDLIPPPAVMPPPINTPAAATNPSSTAGNSLTAAITKPRESTGTTQFLANPPPPPHIKNQQQKESKRKTLKEKLTGVGRRKDLLRTIDRLQPGKAKGNLIGSGHTTSKTEELFPPTAANKIKEVKNSLVVKTDEFGPKLSMGSVLQTENFGLGQLHNFADNGTETKPTESPPPCGDDTEKKQAVPDDIASSKADEIEKPKAVEKEKSPQKSEKVNATPNLSAWFKAFGAPKKAKKVEEEEKKTSESTFDTSQGGAERSNSDQANSCNSLNAMKSPPSTSDTFSLPAPRQRKASTGSTVSERSSFSQDPDSPRVGIDDRFGAYAGPYPSPIGASPIMVSPKPDEIGKPTSPYPLNGAIKVGFYQDTTTKSSPEKSCSPRELPSPYPQYSQHIYSSASSPTVNTDVPNTYVGCYNSNSETNKPPTYSSAPASTLFEQYKQPRSQESDYNSMSPNNNSNSPYQQPQNSPYQQHQNSPYQQQNSPYQQPQNSPFQNQSNPSSIMGSSPNSPNMPQTSQGESPSSQQNSPYHQQANSPYQQPTSSPYHQNPTSPYQQQAQPTQPQQSTSSNLSFVQQQQQQQPQQPQAQSTQSPADNAQRPSAESSPYRPEPPSYSMHESTAAGSYQAPNRTTMSNYETDISKQNSATGGLLNKMQSNQDWNTQVDLSVSQTHQSERATVPMSSELTPIAPHSQIQLNTPPLQSNQMNQVQSDKPSLQYPNFSAAYGDSQKVTAKTANMYGNDMTMDMSMGLGRHQQDLPKAVAHQGNLKPQQSETDILNLGGLSDTTNRQPKHDQVQNQMPDKEQPYDSLQKHQQMFDSFLGSMVTNKNLQFAKSLEIPPSKAFEMFNRAATMGFSKDFTNPLSAGQQQKTTSNPVVGNTHATQLVQQSYHLPSAGTKSMDSPAVNSMVQNANKPLNMASNSYPQQMQQHLHENVSSKMSTFPNPMSNPAADINKLQQHASPNVFGDTNKHGQQLTATNYSSSDKIGNDGMARQDQMGQLARSQQLNMDLTGYKTYNNPAAMLDPLRNLNHPLSMMDESLLGLSGSSAPAGYYDKNIPPAAHMFSKNLSQQMYQNTSPYSVPPRDQNISNNYGPTAPNPMNAAQNIEPSFETKPTKRKKKKTATANSNEIATNPGSMLPTQQSSLQAQNPQSTQGFQLYSDLKTATSVSVTDASAISLKTASSMVPGSAFNFGPSPTGLGLPAGMYGDNSGYLDPYYLPSTHRAGAETTNDKPNNAATAAIASATPYQLLAHNPVRPTYPFMNSQLDPNSPIYQQYIQRQEQELRARMMINQGLLGSAAGAAGTYAQPSYRPPTLGMPKHYDMSRQTWF